MKVIQKYAPKIFVYPMNPFSASEAVTMLSMVIPVGVMETPSLFEMSACLNRMVRNGFLSHHRSESTDGKWVEPRYVPTKPVSSGFVSHPPMMYPFSMVRSPCDRCKMMISGKGRHSKTKRGHGKEECDMEMVRVYMGL